MQKLPLDINSFEQIRSHNGIYVDKTEHIYKLISAPSQYYFLSRPARFGKSLLLSTLQEIFLGKRHLFDNLWIGTQSTYTWTAYPVISLDFSELIGTTSDAIEADLSQRIEAVALGYGIDVSSPPFPSLKLLQLITELAKKHNRVVVLINECDYPILQAVEDTSRAEEICTLLSDCFCVLKSQDQHLRATFITASTQFAKTWFSPALNHLTDLTMDPKASTLLGFTDEEVIDYFEYYLERAADEHDITRSTLLSTIKLRCGGYRFSRHDQTVFNPSSLLHSLAPQQRKDFPQKPFLISLLQKKHHSLCDIGEVELSEMALSHAQINNMHLIPYLFQLGYLTVAQYNEEIITYRVDYPNVEARDLVANLASLKTSIDLQR